MIKLYNSLSRKKEEFKPINNSEVGMYNCGPTVYNFAHVGNMRSYVFADILRRTLEYNNHKVKQVVNITDFGHLTDDADQGEDKMTKGLKREGLPLTMDGLKTLADKYTKAFFDDLEKLNIKEADVYPRASEHIEEYISIIKKLEEKELTYKTSDGIYFDTSKIDDYGKLGGLSDENEARIETNLEKKNYRDFALWKFNDSFGWESPWGNGFPGWHIECSGMSAKYLGETFDIHTGGIDHIPVHHNNEIAQSEHASDKPFANHWLHNNHIQMNGDKLAKSTGNVAYIKDLEESGLSPLSYRYWLLLSHYRTQTDFTIEAVKQAQNALENMIVELYKIESKGTIDEDIKKDLTTIINDDLNTPKAIAFIWDLLKQKENRENIKATILDFDKVLGLDLKKHLQKMEEKTKNLSTHIKNLLERREIARANKDWAMSDEIRDLLNEHGFRVEDTENGQVLLPIDIL